MSGVTKKPVNEALLRDACNTLRATVESFIERAQLGDVKGVLERGAAIPKLTEAVAEVLTGTGITP